MNGGHARPLPLDTVHADFIQGGVSVIVASRNAALEPDVVRGCGCRVSRDRRRVTVLIDRARAESVLADFAANSMIAVVYSQPSTHRTIQLKGSDATLVHTAPRDPAIAAAHREHWIEELCSLGYTATFAAAVWGPMPRALAAVAFTPTAAFQQTPGPGAGQPLER